MVAIELRLFASDVLRGDLSCVPALRADRDRMNRERKEARRIHDYEGAVARAAEVFTSHDIRSFLCPVTPYKSLWSKAMTLKVEIIRRKLG